MTTLLARRHAEAIMVRLFVALHSFRERIVEGMPACIQAPA